MAMKIDFDRLSTSQISNFKGSLEAYKERSPISSGSPPVLFIELTQNCISRCSFCRGEKWVNKPLYNMNREIFAKLIQDYIPYAILVDLRSRGESLMLPNFDEYVSEVAKFGPKIRLTTTLGCGSKKVLQSLIDNDVFVSVSFDAADKRLYESIRSRVKYDTVIANLDFITNGMKSKYGTLEDKIRLSVMPLQGKNLRYVEGVFKLAKHYGISDIMVGPLGTSESDISHLNNNKYQTLKAMEKAVDLSKKMGIRLNIIYSLFDEFKLEEKSFDLCCHPWLYAQINYKGDLSHCDHLAGALHADHTFGNIKEEKAKVWNGKKAQGVRVAHADCNKEKIFKRCNQCYIEGRYADHEHEIDNTFSRWLVREDDIELIIKNIRREKLRFFCSDCMFRAKRITKKTLQKAYNFTGGRSEA